MTFKYTLDPSPKKYICPSCDKKRFVRCIEVATQKLAPPQFGKCDRADNCGYSNYPKGDNRLSKLVQEIVHINEYNHFLPIKIVAPTLRLYQQNNFIQFLLDKFNTEEVEVVIQTYKIGTAKRFVGATLFWLIDINNKLRSGKIMQYDSISGNRIKEPKAKIDWVHKRLEWENKLPVNFKLKQCLFGEHLVNQLKNCNKIIGIIESEKSAIIMSIVYPNYIWLSCGSISGIKLSLLLPIKDREIVVYPDKSCYDKWKLEAKDLNKHGFNIIVSKLLEGIDIENGADLVDLFLDVDQEFS